MKLVDANVLIYSVDDGSPWHEPSRTWLNRALSGGFSIAFAWIALVAFMRVTTHRRLFASPLSPEEAIGFVQDWLAQPSAVIVEPTARHLGIVEELLAPLGTGGNLVNDAHLAALAIEHRCEIVSFDRDFERFEGIRLESPS